MKESAMRRRPAITIGRRIMKPDIRTMKFTSEDEAISAISLVSGTSSILFHGENKVRSKTGTENKRQINQAKLLQTP